MIKLIRTKKDHKAALARVYELMQSSPAKGSPEYDELELLAVLIEHYEEKHFPMDPPDPIEAILFRLEQLNMAKSELAVVLGSKSRASEILNRKRKLSLSMIRTLNKKLQIPLSALISEY